MKVSLKSINLLSAKSLRQSKKRLSFFLNDFKSYQSKYKKTKDDKKKTNPLKSIYKRTLSKHNAKSTNYGQLVMTLVLNPKTAYHKLFDEMLIEINSKEFLNAYYFTHGDDLNNKLRTVTITPTNMVKVHPFYFNFSKFVYEVMTHNISSKKFLLKLYLEIKNKKQTAENSKDHINLQSLDISRVVVGTSIEKDEEKEDVYHKNEIKEHDSIDEIEVIIEEIERGEIGMDYIDNNNNEYDNKYNEGKNYFPVHKRSSNLHQRMMSVIQLQNNDVNNNKYNNKEKQNEQHIITKEELIFHIQQKKLKQKFLTPHMQKRTQYIINEDKMNKYNNNYNNKKRNGIKGRNYVNKASLLLKSKNSFFPRHLHLEMNDSLQYYTQERQFIPTKTFIRNLHNNNNKLFTPQLTTMLFSKFIQNSNHNNHNKTKSFTSLKYNHKKSFSVGQLLLLSKNESHSKSRNKKSSFYHSKKNSYFSSRQDSTSELEKLITYTQVRMGSDGTYKKVLTPKNKTEKEMEMMTTTQSVRKKEKKRILSFNYGNNYLNNNEKMLNINRQLCGEFNKLKIKRKDFPVMLNQSKCNKNGKDNNDISKMLVTNSIKNIH